MSETSSVKNSISNNDIISEGLKEKIQKISKVPKVNKVQKVNKVPKVNKGSVVKVKKIKLKI